MFVDPTDFTDIPYKIPNKEETRAFVDWIEAEETKILKEVLGLPLYNAFIEGLDTSGSIEQKWLDLRDGAEYEYSDSTYEYLGLVDFLKPEIYSRWFYLRYRVPTSSGVVINTGQQNTTVQNPDVEVSQYHNIFVEKIGNSCNQKNTLFGFLTVNEEDYQEDGEVIWNFTEQKLTNQFNL